VVQFWAFGLPIESSKFENQERRAPRQRLGSTALTVAVVVLGLAGLAIALIRFWR